MIERWTSEHSERAWAEGWDVFSRSEGQEHQIQKADEADVFESDEEALGHVRKRAMEGSPMHLLALDIEQFYAAKHSAADLRSGAGRGAAPRRPMGEAEMLEATVP